MLKKNLLILCCAFLFVLTGCDKAKVKEEVSYTIATESGYAPFAYEDKTGNLVGFDIELIDMLCDDLKVKCNIVVKPWDGLLDDLAKNKYDAVIAAVSITPDRKKVLDFTDSYFDNKLAMLYDTTKGVNTTDFSNAKISVLKDSLALKELKKLYPKATLVTTDTQPVALDMLGKGDVNAAFADQITLFDWYKKQDSNTYEILSDITDIADKFAIALPKGSKFTSDLNVALTGLKADGSYEQLFSKYFTDFDWVQNLPDIPVDEQ